jgi:urea transport system substrate-binding protein
VGPIKIGIIADLSGPLGSFGATIRNGALLAVSEINEAGGIAGREVVPIVEDTETDVTVTAEKARKLVDEDRVDVVIGPIASNINDVVFQIVAQEAGILQLYPTLYEGGKCHPAFFSLGAVPAQQLRPLITLLQKEYGTFAMLFGADYVWPQRSFEIARPIIEETRGIVVAELLLPLVTDDFTPFIEAVRETQPDYILSLYPAAWGPALQALEDADLLDGVGVGTATVGDQELEVLGSLADGHYTAQQLITVSEGPGSASFITDYAAAYEGSAAGGTGLGAYNAVYMYKAAVEAAGTTESSAVADAMVGLSIEGPTGRVTMTPSHHLEQPISIAQSQRGSYTLIETIPATSPEQDCDL